MNKAYINIASLIIGCLFIGLMTLLFGDSTVGIVMLDSQSSVFYYPFTIQNLSYMLFFIGLGELFARWHRARYEDSLTTQKFLPEDEETVLESKDLPNIRLKTVGRYTEEEGFVPMLIDTCILRFQASASVEQTLQVLGSYLELYSHKIELRYQTVRYIVWVIPTIGFIGTVVGISWALSAIDPANLKLKELTSTLALAFNTTLVALILSGILMFVFNRVQTIEESALNRAGEYVLKNLINRLYVQRR